MWLIDVWLEKSLWSLAVGPGLIPTACSGFLEPILFWKDTLLGLNIEGRALVPPPQSDVPDFVDSPWEALP